ncbi:FUSC family protein [Leucobacter sp. CSA2]|uniref:FUSC family protein n=2 Tax=Leucobacter edaphi TaxID=2796472 RepID=A0A934QER1_9MICO|nr:FUSC family protein [Leucobacter edaphi]MBK0421807.1 FUSC family protein [Leucobacter edaphi]
MLSAARTAFLSLFVVSSDAPPRGWIALRAAISIGVPLGLLTALGHEAIGIQTSAGAFVALYAAGHGARERAKVLPAVAGVIIACAALGVLLAPSVIWTAIGLVVVAVGTSAFAFGYRLGPPGPVFFVLVYGLSGNITTVVDGQRVNDPVVYLLAVAAGAAFSYLVALAPLVRPAERWRAARPIRELLPGPWLGKGELELLFRILIIAVLGIVLSAWLADPHRAYWAVSTGVAVVGLSAVRSHAIARGVHRTVGTLLGAALALAVAPLGRNALALVLVVTALQFLIELVVVRNYALALVFITPLVLLITVAATGAGDVIGPTWERVIDTVIGSCLAVVTGVLHRRN